MKHLILVCLAFAAPAVLADSPFEFDYDSKNDMRGASFMCATTGFTEGECPTVLKKCWKPPMIYFKRHKSHYHVKSYCFSASAVFSGEESDGHEAIVYASNLNDEDDENMGDVLDNLGEAVAFVGPQTKASKVSETKQPKNTNDALFSQYSGFSCLGFECLDLNLPTEIESCLVVTVTDINGDKMSSETCGMSIVPYGEAAQAHGTYDCSVEKIEENSVETCNSFFSVAVAENVD